MSLLFENPPTLGEIDDSLTTADIAWELYQSPGQWARIREASIDERNKLDQQAYTIRYAKSASWNPAKGSFSATVRRVGDVVRLYARYEK